jgi:hypothetical protein
VEQSTCLRGRLQSRANGVNVSEDQPPLDHQYSEKTMLDLHHDDSRPSHVRVAFTDRMLSFMLSKDATFEDLADRLRDLDERHRGKPVAIEVKLATSPDGGRRRFLSELGRGIGTAAPKGTLQTHTGRPISAI